MAKYTTILFDFDGTLFNSKKGIVSAVKYSLNHFDIPVPDDDTLQTFIGPPLGHSFQKHFGLSKEDAYAAIAKLREYYGDKGIFESELYEGIDEILKSLKNRSLKVGIATAKPTVYTHQILEHNKLSHYFDTVRGSSLVGELFPKEQTIGEALQDFGISSYDEQSKSKTVMIGDTIYDIKGAHHHQIPSIAVNYGFGKKQDLLDSRPTHLAETVEELRGLLEG
jgi:phosphoglycolate phosphatase